MSSGRCNICGWEGSFIKPELGREGMHCGNCSATSRHRAVIRALGVVLGYGPLPLFRWPVNKSLAALESSARGSYPVMLADKFDYYPTEYDPEKITSGTNPRGFADFQKLQFADCTFDVVIASDVFEHVRRDREALREIWRVLKDHGSLILTVPYDHSREKTVQRVDTTGETDRHLMEPEYHGGGGHTLTYRNYGRDLLSLLRDEHYSVAHMETDVPQAGISPQSVFIAQKGEYVELIDSGPATTTRERVGVLLPYRMFLLFRYNVRGFLHYWREMKRKSHA